MDAPTHFAARSASKRGAGRARIAVLIVGVPLAIVVLALWSERRPIAVHFVDRELRARGVSARYRIVAIGPGVERIADVSIGDPAAPDLVARNVVVRLRYGWRGPEVGGIEADGVRLRGRLIDGHVRFGAIDRLLPPPSNTPFALPDLALRLRDARMRLDTDAGAIGLALSGSGNLARSFGGSLAMTAPRLGFGGCVVERVAASLTILTTARRPSLKGPVGFAGLACGGVGSGRTVVNLAVGFDETLAHWQGTADAHASGLAGGGARLAGASARIGFAGDAGDTHGTLDLTGERLVAPSGFARTIAAAGGFATAPSPSFTGTVRLAHATLAPGAGAGLDRIARSTAATPAGPLAAALANALKLAGRDASASAHLAVARGGLRLDRAAVDSASGARLRFAGAASYARPSGAIGLAGTLATGGGGLPELRLAVRPAPGGEYAGSATLAPYAAGGARLALAPIRIVTKRGTLHLATIAMLDGPLGGGRIEGLAAPLAATIGRGGFALDPGCVAVGFRALAIAGARFAPARLRACPTMGASVLATGAAGLRFGARFDRVALGGSVGASPLGVAAGGITVSANGFTARSVAVRLGAPDRQTRLDLATLDGATHPGGIGGHLTGGSGQIGAVPLLMSRIAGDWTLDDAVLAIRGGLQVADAQTAAPRFEPLAADDVALDLRGGTIRATGTLRQPKTHDAISTVAIVHDLATGSGDATLGVRGIAFTPLLQPELLTRLTLGLVADVRGTVAGEGRIRWTPRGVASTGDFETGGVDLSAAFGPVKGIKGHIHFSDLLALETPPGQIATIAEANPGVAVNDGVVRYRLLAGQRVEVEAGRWPFAGGELILEPTVMDFSHDVERHLTFTVRALDAAKFIEQLALPNVAATGTFDGTMPMIFDAKGGRIEGGHLVVRPGGGTLAYVGEITKAQLGVFGKLAFDALKSIRYQHLAIDLAGSLDGELVSRVNFNGVNQAPLGTGTPFRKTLRKLPFTFNITIRAPFRGLLGSAENFIDPEALVRSSIGQPATAAVQPPVSGAKP